MQKKFLSILLSLLIILTITPLSFAAEEAALTSSSAQGEPGETVTLNISLANNPGIVSANLRIAFDEGLTLVGATNGKVFSTLTYIPPKRLSSVGEITSNCQFAWTGFDIEDKDIKNGVILSLDFKISQTAKAGESFNVTISSEKGDVIDRNLNEIVLSAAGKVEVSNGKTITPISDFEYTLGKDGIIITAYIGTKEDVALGESYEIGGKTYSVVEIGESAFEGNKKVKSVSIPATVKAIGDYAFYDCTSLTGITVLGKNTTIGELALGYYYISRKENGVVEGFTIYGHKGSTAENYAKGDVEITFVALAEDKPCTHKGGTANCVDKKICTLCGKEYGSVDITNHKKVVADNAVAPLCYKNGYTKGSHCESCDEVVVAQIIVPATGNHIYGSQCKANGDGTHSFKCTTLGCTAYSGTTNCSGGNATCTNKAECKTCSSKYGDYGQHIDANGDAYCDTCGLDLNPQAHCTCNCHKTGIVKFFFVIVNFFQKLFGSNKVCACGAAH